MKKIKHKNIKNFSLVYVLKSSIKFILLFKRTFFIWTLLNFSFFYILFQIPNGWTNSWSILWLCAYYVYWCIFIRYIQQHQPYFSLIRILNGLVPTSKIMFINISIYLVIVIIPYVPLFMGFRDKYLEFFEAYMTILQSHNSLLGKMLFYFFMLLISPWTFSRPYLAWISSLIGKSRSIMDAYQRTTSNYWRFVCIAFILSLFFVTSYWIDVVFNIDTLLFTMSILPICFNIVFIKLYKIFYTKTSNG